MAGSRRAVLATSAPRGEARLVPICFAVEPEPGGEGLVVIWSPLDDKPKRTADPLQLARVRDILRDPAVTLLVDRWSEDWSRLGWLRLRGTASIAGPEHAGHGPAVERLRDKYPQYRDHALESRPMIRIAVESATSWGNLAEP